MQLCVGDKYEFKDNGVNVILVYQGLVDRDGTLWHEFVDSSGYFADIFPVTNDDAWIDKLFAEGVLSAITQDDMLRKHENELAAIWAKLKRK